MAYFYTDADNYSIEQKIECLEQVISNLCGRFDGFEEKLLKFETLLKEIIKGSLENIECEDSTNTDVFDKYPNSISPQEFVSIGYCGQPEGPGFDEINITEEPGIRSLYEIRKIDTSHALFFPLEDKLSRFRNNSASLLLPVCDIDGDITECQAIVVVKGNYGTLELEDKWEKNIDFYSNSYSYSHFCLAKKCIENTKN